MFLSLSLLISLLSFLIGFILLITILVFYQKQLINHRNIKNQYAREYLYQKYILEENPSRNIKPLLLLKAYLQLVDQVHFTEKSKTQLIHDLSSLHKRFMKELNHPFSYYRKRAACYLGIIDDTCAPLLQKRLECEKNHTVKQYLLFSIKRLNNAIDVDGLVMSVVGTNERYMTQVSHFIIDQYPNLEIKHYFNYTPLEVKIILMDYLNTYPKVQYAEYVIEELNKIEAHLYGNRQLEHLESYSDYLIKSYLYKIMMVVNQMNYPYLLQNRFLNHSSLTMRKWSLYAYLNRPSVETMNQLISSLDGSTLDQDRMNIMIKLANLKKELYKHLMSRFKDIKQVIEKQAILYVLSNKIDYLILKLNSKDRKLVIQMIHALIEERYTADLIDFLNHNKDLELENELLELIEVHLVDLELRQLFSRNLNGRILIKLDLQREDQVVPKKEVKPDHKKVRWLIQLLILNVLFFPILFIVRHYDQMQSYTIAFMFKRYVLDLNYYFIYYYLLINVIYFILMILAYMATKKQNRLWSLKTKQFLFEPDLLPSISILSPAYNEELTIVESVQSLLNLNYPNYEVIVVNDGSKDQTLNRLIDRFDLERKDGIIKSTIHTKRVRSVYINKNLPNLIVIDKENGGKADSLNVGINASKKDYVCGIDADSLLEHDALLKLTSTVIDHQHKTLALGGNIIPANGFTIEQGTIEASRLSSEILVQFQTMEYCRAFTSGRMGWSKINGLLIISGAFGLFEKQMLMRIGGYMTYSSEYQKDTVGEDMELVVRMSKRAFDKGIKANMDFVLNAKCFTEVPSDRKSLLRQRDRWHRGLIDILSYHRSMMFNPKYKQIGLISLPYFFLFETIGPLFEVQAYLALFLSLLMGWLDITILIGVFIASILFGILNSLVSLYIAEHESVYLSKYDTIKLIFLAIIENFGYRQFISLYRVKGLFTSLRSSSNWGVIMRSGFNSSRKHKN